MDGNFTFFFIGVGAMDNQFAYECIEFWPMDRRFPYEFIRVGAMDDKFAYEFLRFWAQASTCRGKF